LTDRDSVYHLLPSDDYSRTKACFQQAVGGGERLLGQLDAQLIGFAEQLDGDAEEEAAHLPVLPTVQGGLGAPHPIGSSAHRRISRCRREKPGDDHAVAEPEVAWQTRRSR